MANNWSQGPCCIRDTSKTEQECMQARHFKLQFITQAAYFQLQRCNHSFTSINGACISWRPLLYELHNTSDVLRGQMRHSYFQIRTENHETSRSHASYHGGPRPFTWWLCGLPCLLTLKVVSRLHLPSFLCPGKKTGLKGPNSKRTGSDAFSFFSS